MEQHMRKSRGSAKRGESPGKREERVDRQVRQRRTEDMGRGDEEEKAIEALLQHCRERAEGYELGGAALVEKSPGGAPGRAEEESIVQGRACGALSQHAELEAEAAGMDRGLLAEGVFAGGNAAGERQKGGEHMTRGSQFFQGESGRPQMKESRWDVYAGTPRLDFNPCRGGDVVHRSPRTTGQGVSEQAGHDLEELRLMLQNKSQQEEMVVGEMGPLLSRMLEVFDDQLNTRCSQASEGIFPLPLPTQLGMSGAQVSFLEALVRGLNLLAGTRSRWLRTPSKVSQELVCRLEQVLEGCELLKEKVPRLTFREFFRTKTIDYSGEEVKVARRFTWQMIEAALPQGVGSLVLTEFCTQGTLDYVRNFEQCLLPDQDQHLGKTPAIMVEQSDWAEVCRGLVARGVCGPMKRGELHHVRGRPLLNGLFAVEKGERAVGADGIEFDVRRLIMNLVPTNSLCRNLVGDTATLPSIVGLTSIILEDSELLLTSSEDIRCFFYLFQTPPEWWPYMGFAREVPEEALPGGYSGREWHLVTKVLPMGFINSVAIAQHVHRRVIGQALYSGASLASKHQEIRRDRPNSRADHLFRVYLDNFDELRKVDRRVAELVEGQPSDWTLAIRETYTCLGLPRHPKKAVEQSMHAEVQGAWVDGSRGTATPKFSKVARYLSLAMEAVVQGKASQRELQIIGGGFVYIAMFRRPLLSGLNAIWKKITSLKGISPHQRSALSREVEVELIRFIAMSPLAFMNFRLPVSEHVTASDASTTGGGLCVSRGLSPYGLAASQAEARGDVLCPDEIDQILVISLFDGIGALRVALDCLRVPVAGFVSVKLDDHASRVVESYFPDVIRVTDVGLVDLEMMRGWGLRFPSVSLVLLGAGPPCQGVSGLNVDRKGAMKDARSSLFQHIPRIEQMARQVFKWCPLHRLIENVASMDKVDCLAMNQAYGMEPWVVDAHGISLARRPRLYWMDWEMGPQEGVAVAQGRIRGLPVQGNIQLHGQVDDADYLEPGWRRVKPSGSFPTFTTARPSDTPGRKPAGLALCPPEALNRWRSDSHRFPPYQYRDENCVVNSQGIMRVPSISEREVILGFPLGYTRRCMTKAAEGSTSHSDCRLKLLGNSWSVPVVCVLLSSLFRLLGWLPSLSVQEILDRLTPGCASDLAGLLLRPPLRHSSQVTQPGSGLVRKLLGQVSVKGEDILLQMGSDVPARYHRLRALLPSKLWRWRDVIGWRWKGDVEHINALELRAVKTSLVWRIRELREGPVRFVHLVDSLVALHALSRGRSSSRKLRRTLAKISALLLASGSVGAWSYVDTHQNPADRPSRRPVHRKWVRKVQK